MNPTSHPPTPTPRYNPDAAIQPVQIIVFALMAGVVVSAAIATVLAPNGPNDAGNQTLCGIYVALTAVTIATRFVVSPIVVKCQMNQLRKKLQSKDESDVKTALFGIFQMKTFIENALLEGAAFFCVVALLVTGAWWLLAIVGALLVLMAMMFPTKGRIEQFIHEREQQFEFEGDR